MIEIREALRSDAAAILEYCKLIGGESDNLSFGPEGIPFTVEQEEHFLENAFQSPRQAFFVAVDQGEIIGTASFAGFPRPRLSHRGEISISVRKSRWGQHIGTCLMERLISFARQIENMEIISLEVRSDNRRAIHLYENFGFKTIGTFRGFMKIDGCQVDYDLMQLYL